MDAWYNNPIELSINNQGKTGVTATVNFSATTAITAGELCITFPASFTVTGALLSAANTGTG